MGIEWIIGLIALLVGAGAGGGITFGVMKKKQRDEPVVIVDNAAATVQAEVAQELSNLDLVEPLCVEAFIEKHGDGLCRELYCWAQTNSTTGEANAVACEAISNLNNTRIVIETCGPVASEGWEDCLDAFRERK